MRETPDIARITALIGDPARAQMLNALMSGMALTAGELAQEAGVSPATASAHLKHLREGSLVCEQREGRHKYFRIKDHQAAQLLETISAFSERSGPKRVRPGPKDPALRSARMCYDHLAGALGVHIFTSMASRGFLSMLENGPVLNADGERFIGALGLDLNALKRSNRATCRCCLDWSERRYHLSGTLGAALTEMMVNQQWVKRINGSRALEVTSSGRHELERHFPGFSER